MKKRLRIIISLMFCAILTSSCANTNTGAAQPPAEQQALNQVTYTYTKYPLERNGILLHLDCMKVDGTESKDNILLMHGSTYSSNEFDINYEDYSLVRRLARDGYAVWRLDVAGYGQSGKVEDGLMPDTAYAAEDTRAAMELISNETGMDKIDLLGWSWGTMTTGLYAAEYPEHLDKLVLYAPILSGIGEAEITEPFNHNDWAGAAEDFQTKEDGNFDLDVTDPVLIEMWCSSCWHYDGDSSPNGWRKDALVSEDNVLIDLTKITVPTLVICGDKDPYLNMDLVKKSPDLLPEGSELKVIEGGFFHNDGSWVDENTLLITLIGTPQIVVYKIAKEVCTAFHQESVMITSNAVVRFNVHDDPDMLGYKNSGEAGWAQTPEIFKI